MTRSSTTYVQGIAQDKANRERDDFYPTPPRATRALLAVEKFVGAIWEPACGDGAICKELQNAGYGVVATDLIDRGYGESGQDFLLSSSMADMADNIVTNPPYKLAEEFAHRALLLSRRKVALLCRLAWLEGKVRRKMFLSTPIARVWVFSARLTMVRNGDPALAGGGSMIAYAWYVWDKEHSGPPQLGWLP